MNPDHRTAMVPAVTGQPLQLLPPHLLRLLTPWRGTRWHDLEVGFVYDSSDDKVRLMLVTSYAGSKKVNVYAPGRRDASERRYFRHEGGFSYTRWNSVPNNGPNNGPDENVRAACGRRAGTIGLVQTTLTLWLVPTGARGERQGRWRCFRTWILMASTTMPPKPLTDNLTYFVVLTNEDKTISGGTTTTTYTLHPGRTSCSIMMGIQVVSLPRRRRYRSRSAPRRRIMNTSTSVCGPDSVMPPMTAGLQDLDDLGIAFVQNHSGMGDDRRHAEPRQGRVQRQLGRDRPGSPDFGR